MSQTLLASERIVKPMSEAGLLHRRLKDNLRGDVLFDMASRGRYSTDASIYQITPTGVVVPRDQDDVLMALEIARDVGAPVLSRGGGTSQCGQTVGEALIIDNSRWLNQIVEFDADARTVTVEPGMVLDHLNAWLKPHGLWFPVDVSTAAQCTIGGMAGNNSCGSRSIAYGNMVHNVLAIDAVLADGHQTRFGHLSSMSPDVRTQEIVAAVQDIARREDAEIVERYPKVLRRVAGYNLDLFHCQNPRPYTDDGSPNLAHLLVGAEGTLAYSRQITLQLSPLPVHKVLGVVNFPTFYQAMEMTQHIVTLGPVAVELVDRTMIDLSMRNPAFKAVIERALVGHPEAVLLVEFSGEDASVLNKNLDELVTLMADLGLPGSVIEMTDARAQKDLWEVRKAGLNIMMSMKGNGKPVSFIEDCAVPLQHLAEYTRQLTEVFHKNGTEGTWYAHASVGTLHVRPILDMRRDGGSKMRAIAEEAAALVRHYKGAYSGEHGDGLCRGEWVAWQYGPRINDAFREIKHLFDPDNHFNPDKMIDPPRMDEASLFRFPQDYRVIPISTQLDWSDWNVDRDPLTGEESGPGTGGDPSQGLAMAVEMCNNNGHCRKFDAGTMCPSYRVTKDEQHLTRGRANTLRLAVSGQLGKDGLASTEVRDALALCVSCKGCKRECPTGVDMARFKIEARAAWNQAHGLTLRDRLVAYMPRYAAWASRLRHVFNIVDRVPVLSPWLKKQLGFAPQRSLPRFEAAFSADSSLHQPLQASETDGDPIVGEHLNEVVLFVDTFNNYMEPENVRAARAVLQAAGYTVHLSISAGQVPLCCGRTYLAAGLVEQARSEARRTLDTLMPFVNRGVSIVGLEPSCLLTLRDEFLSYGFGDEAHALAQAACLFEEFLVKEHDEGRLMLELKSIAAKDVYVHGHCHQKAFEAFQPVKTVLSWIPGITVHAIESSCCGMAGSFGYEAEHYDVSMRMGELSLLPSVRHAPEDAFIVADGTSCRHQIYDGTQRSATHVAQVLVQSLKINIH